VNRAIAVVGPTGSGKTRLAIELAKRLDTEIISADSMQFYRGMEIGTAAPTADEQAEVKHHFVGFLQPDEEMAAGQYQRLAREKALELLRQGRVPVLAGGSGLYISAFIDGLFDGPARNQAVRDRLRAEAAARGNAALMERLRAVDPDYAAQLTSENDLVRVVRALEVFEVTGRTFSHWHREHQATLEPWDVAQAALLWERDALYERINRRVDMMAAQGWREETQRLVDNGYEKDIYRLKALGYQEMAACLRGERTLDEALEATKQHHRRYAKRQMTWFRSDKRIRWLPADDETAIAAWVEETARGLSLPADAEPPAEPTW